MKPLIVLMLFVLGACGTESTTAVNFQDPKTGEVAAVCGPLVGFSAAVDEARQGCVESYKDDGWTEID